MDYKRSPVTENVDTKAEFRKPSVEASSRKYRRRSPVNRSSSSDGSPKRDRSSSPNLSREDVAKDSGRRPRRKDDGSELDRDSSRSQYGRSSHSYRQSCRSSHGYSRHDDFVRHDKYTDEEERDYRQLSSRSGRESRGGIHSDHTRQRDEHGRSKDFFRDVDNNSRDKYDSLGHRSRDKGSSYERTGSGRRHAPYDEVERDVPVRDRSARDDRRDYRRSSGDYKNDSISSYEEPRGNRNDAASGRDDARLRLKEAYKSDPKELDGSKPDKEERRKNNDREKKWDKDQYGKELRGQFDDTGVSAKENQESPAKNPKLFSFDKEVNNEKDAEEKQSSSSKQARDDKMIQGQGQSSDTAAVSDLSAAKVAAMKAAELVNKNIAGVGFMTTDQKKKLLWGNKKSTAAEESGNRWDTTLFTDRERQEKFNKLMGVKGDVKIEHSPNNQDGSEQLRAEKQKELQVDLEKQYTAGLRRRDGRTVGLGL